jgi:hypothetical protein
LWEKIYINSKIKKEDFEKAYAFSIITFTGTKSNLIHNKNVALLRSSGETILTIDIFYKQNASVQTFYNFTYLAQLLLPSPQFTEQNPQ